MTGATIRRSLVICAVAIGLAFVAVPASAQTGQVKGKVGDKENKPVEGAAMMGLGGALFEAIEFENGRILNSRLSRYRVPRFSDLPVIEAVLVDRKDLPSAGAGETPIVAVAPAIGSAIFAATGTRLRSLPMAPNGLKGYCMKIARPSAWRLWRSLAFRGSGS